MIKVNETLVEVEHFPDGTPKIKLDTTFMESLSNDDHSDILFEWIYENDAEAIHLMYLKRHIEQHAADAYCYLYMPYIPNARMDRVKYIDEVFTLKYFCEFINALNFDEVFVYDAHSNVSVALLNNCFQYNPEREIKKVLGNIHSTSADDEVVLYFPDMGAAKKYVELFPSIKYCCGEKKRDWNTGKILGLDVMTNGIDLTEKTVLMVDDIVSFGGSLYYSALELKNRGVSKIFAFVSHAENSVLDREKGTLIKLLEDGTVEHLFTTDSIFTGEHEKICVMEVFQDE